MKKNTTPKNYGFSTWCVTQENNNIIARAENNHGYVVLMLIDIIAPDSCIVDRNGTKFIILEKLLKIYP